MSTKTKKVTTAEKISQAATQAGYILMTAIATVGMMDLPNHPEKRIVLPNRPSFAFAENTIESEGNNPLRREREETAPHYISYSVVQRTAPSSGKRLNSHSNRNT
ncbi:MAG TPA: hypothetical protein VH234_05100 [Candidatus Saccharimonadales bacterium]|jgi:hypothetical protein|nr:hypothetical protein [Candidatus Saccharimonadales bacterium]